MAQATATKAPVSQDTIDKCLAKAVSEGDMVNFRLLFLSFSPLREDSQEDITRPKYQYLLPEDEHDKHYKAAMAEINTPLMHEIIKRELARKGPAQLPSELVMLLADNAVRLGKFSTAAQAYELLRIRNRMQEMFYEQGEAALEAGDIKRAVKAFRIAVGLEYDYAAFPEPLPAFPKWPTRALMLHAVYPARIEDFLCLQPLEIWLKVSLTFLLANAQAAARLEKRPQEQQVAFFVELVHQIDPDWKKFAERYKKAAELVREIGERLKRDAEHIRKEGETLEEVIEDLTAEVDPQEVPATLVGRRIEPGEWWQYIKDLAYLHPAGILFVSRQLVSKDSEIIMPRHVAGNPVVKALGLEVS